MSRELNGRKESACANLQAELFCREPGGQRPPEETGRRIPQQLCEDTECGLPHPWHPCLVNYAAFNSLALSLLILCRWVLNYKENEREDWNKIYVHISEWCEPRFMDTYLFPPWCVYIVYVCAGVRAVETTSLSETPFPINPTLSF